MDNSTTSKKSIKLINSNNSVRKKAMHKTQVKFLSTSECEENFFSDFEEDSLGNIS